MKILGAGLAGLIAANLFPMATVQEAAAENQINHRALLRFRSSAVGDALGIEFRRVRVHKGIWWQGKFVPPSIQMANLYSQKVIGQLRDRSIWNLESVDRFVAPEDFIEQLIDRCWPRIYWSAPADHTLFEPDRREPVLSTIPMSVMMDLLHTAGHESPSYPTPHFTHEPITVQRWRLPGSDVFQTVYFPDPFHSLYRASITGDLLIAEHVGVAPAPSLEEVLRPFGLTSHLVEPVGESAQRFGKISPIDDAWRKQFMFNLTHEHGIYSLGRFATWRNILLDDVLKDISVVKKLMSSAAYDRKRVLG